MHIEIEFFIDYFDPIHLFLLIFKTMKNIPDERDQKIGTKKISEIKNYICNFYNCCN